ncbi:MAG: DUF1403 family protein [Mesorhizobium sp.]|nr:MAG: DUF1403 family protein [Mesorhizobium sp.]
MPLESCDRLARFNSPRAGETDRHRSPALAMTAAARQAGRVEDGAALRDAVLPARASDLFPAGLLLLACAGWVGEIAMGRTPTAAGPRWWWHGTAMLLARRCPNCRSGRD